MLGDLWFLPMRHGDNLCNVKDEHGDIVVRDAPLGLAVGLTRGYVKARRGQLNSDIEGIISDYRENGLEKSTLDRLVKMRALLKKFDEALGSTGFRPCPVEGGL